MTRLPGSRWSRACIAGRSAGLPGTCRIGGRRWRSCGNVGDYLSDELGFGRLLDYGVIVPRLQQPYEWSAHELGAPGLLDCIRDGNMTYAWPFEERGVWRPRRSVILQMARRVLPPERRARRNGDLPS
jgi:hypothetical protein